MTQYRMNDPYEMGESFIPKPRIPRSYTNEAVIGSAAEAATSLGEARRNSRQWRFGDEYMDPNLGYNDLVDRGDVPYEREQMPDRGGANSPYGTDIGPDRGRGTEYLPYSNAEQGTSVQYQMDPMSPPPYAGQRPPPRSNSPFVPTQAQQRPPMQMPLPSQSATMMAGVAASMPQQAQPPMSLADTFSPAAIAAQRAQREAANRPGANAIFKPQPMVGGRPDNVADNVAMDVIARAAMASARGDANAEDMLNQAATLAWQREAAVNGNERGDTAAPQDYIESWKGQVRAGEGGSPFADMFGRASQVARQSVAAEEMARREAATAQERRMMEAERAQRIRSQTPGLMQQVNSNFNRLTSPSAQPLGTAAEGASYPASRGPAPSEAGRYGTTRMSLAEEVFNRYNGGGATAQTAGPMPAYLQGRTPRSGLVSGKDDPGDQAAYLWSQARQMGGDEFADAVGGLIVAEGGLTGATGDTHLDPRGSHGPFQFYAKGELQPFRQAMSKKYGREISEQEAMQLARNVDEVTAYYLPKLYGAYQDAKKKGFTGDDLTVGLAAGAFDASGAGHNRGITSDPNKFYPIYREGLKNFRAGRFAQAGSIASLANQGR